MTRRTLLWSTQDRSKWFLLPYDSLLRPGTLVVRSLDGQTRDVDPIWIATFEVTEEQMHRWAKDELGYALDELKTGIDERLADLRRQLDEKSRTPIMDNTTVTPNAASALFELLKKLPGVISKSLLGEKKRVESAKTAMTDLQRQLKEAGIDLDERFTNFPDRVADLRKNLKEQTAAKKPTTKNERPSDQR
jgi:hypothetical protein